jgi:Tfp pilus assembly protein PilO
MKQYVFEIFRQKWRIVTVILFLLLLNVVLIVVVSAYQLPSLAILQAKWSSMRQQAVGASQVDAVSLYQQGAADLEKLKVRIPEKRKFAGVLIDLIETASSSGVEVGSFSYKPVQIKEEPLLSYQLSYSVKGGYAAVKSYLADLQKNPELIVVDTVVFSNSDLFVEHVVMDLLVSVYLREGT